MDNRRKLNERAYKTRPIPTDDRNSEFRRRPSHTRVRTEIVSVLIEFISRLFRYYARKKNRQNDDQKNVFGIGSTTFRLRVLYQGKCTLR